MLTAQHDVLSVVDVRSGETKELVKGGVGRWGSTSFSPDGKALVFARNGGTPRHEDESDLYVARISDDRIERLTHDAHSDSPVWGAHWIAFRRYRFANEDHWPVIGELWLMRPDGSDARVLARADADVALAHWGIEPVELSADGKRLLACYSREFSCPPATFTVPDGKRLEPAMGDEALTAYDLSRDGSKVLVGTGGAEGPYDAYEIPFEGGPGHLIARNASPGNWSDVASSGQR